MKISVISFQAIGYFVDFSNLEKRADVVVAKRKKVPKVPKNSTFRYLLKKIQ